MSRNNNNFRIVNNCRNCFYYRYSNNGHDCVYDDSDVLLPEICDRNICDKWSDKWGSRTIIRNDINFRQTETCMNCKLHTYHDSNHYCDFNDHSMLPVDCHIHVCGCWRMK